MAFADCFFSSVAASAAFGGASVAAVTTGVASAAAGGAAEDASSVFLRLRLRRLLTFLLFESPAMSRAILIRWEDNKADEGVSELMRALPAR